MGTEDQEAVQADLAPLARVPELGPGHVAAVVAEERQLTCADGEHDPGRGPAPVDVRVVFPVTWVRQHLTRHTAVEAAQTRALTCHQVPVSIIPHLLRSETSSAALLLPAHLSVSPVHRAGEALCPLAGHHVDKLLEGDG